MKKPELVPIGLGIAVASFLTWHAYYSNSHHTPQISEIVYLVLFPGSIGFMAADNASPFEQIFIVLLLVSVNGALYWVAWLLLRNLFDWAERP
jgi:hypothetical protein